MKLRSTVEEIADMISWVRLDIYKAPCILYNTLNCYDHLRKLYDSMIEDEFLERKELDFMLYSDDIKEIEEFIASYNS